MSRRKICGATATGESHSEKIKNKEKNEKTKEVQDQQEIWM
jgi:hypothetical protein